MKAKIYIGDSIQWIKDKEGKFTIIKKIKKEKKK